MVEVTHAMRDAAEALANRICGCATAAQHKSDVAAVLEYRLAARAELLAELSEPTEAMVEAGADAFGDEFGSAALVRADDENAASNIFRAMITKAGE